MTIARVAVPIATAAHFDYWVPATLPVRRGSIVRVPVGRRLLTGVVVDMPADAEIAPERLRPVAEIMTGGLALPAEILELAKFAADYYQQPLGMMIGVALPPPPPANAREVLPRLVVVTPAGRAVFRESLRGTMRRRMWAELESGDPCAVEELQGAGASARAVLRSWWAHGWIGAVPPSSAGAPTTHAGTALNSEQAAAAADIGDALGRFAVFLLRGVTGSGKTEVYLSAALRAVRAGGQVLLLVPEINLTPQLAERVARALPGIEVATMHSRVPAGERRRAWDAAACGAAQVVLGTRLAVFVPLPRLSLIVVDEEHDASYKQDEGVLYQARDLAVRRGQRRGIPVLLGSATPSLESYLQARRGKYRELTLPARARPGARPPAVRLVPNRGTRAAIFHDAIETAIRERLARSEQSLVFVNRRGFAPSLLCHGCGWAAACDRCAARLVLHQDERELRCHHCGHARAVVTACPDCGNQDLQPVGAGTQRLEQRLRERFAEARIARVDRDTTRRRNAFSTVLDRVLAGELDILVGTQMLAKGHDFPALTLVVVLGADNALYSADFRATERLYAQLTQVAGRAGRAQLPGEVLIQTDFGEHPVFRALQAQDYAAFADVLLEERRVADLPPFAHVALIEAAAHRRADVDRFLHQAEDLLRTVIAASAPACKCFPPSVPVLSRRGGYERGQVLVQAAGRGDLQAVLRTVRGQLAEGAGRRVRWRINVDPVDLG